MFKKLFSKKKSIDQVSLPEADIALRLMFEMAMSDGHLDETELALITKRVKEIAPEDTAVSTIINKVMNQSMESISLYPTVEIINNTYEKEGKKQLLKVLWQLVAADKIIDPYEENLYFKIADLICVERSKANQIKQENS